MTTVESAIDFDAEFRAITSRIGLSRDKRLRQPVVKLHDGDYILRGRAAHIYEAQFTEIDGETGIGTFTMPEEYYLSKWVVDHDSRTTKNIHVTVEKDGIRWSGRMDHYEIEKSSDGKYMVRVIVKHDFEELKHILCWANPFLPAEIQFPKVWLLFAYRPVEKPEMAN